MSVLGKNRKWKQFLTTICLVVMTTLGMSSDLYANDGAPYDTYIYDYYNDIKYTPAAYLPEETIQGLDWNIGALNGPQDMNVTEEGDIYIADTGNNRIIKVDSQFNLISVIDGFEKDGKKETFSNPSGVYVSLKGDLYIADTGNFRVVELDEKGEFIKTIENPQSEVLEDGFVFSPLKVAVDYADRVYVIAKNMFQGIMAFDAEGNFTGFTGKIEVEITTAEKIWRRFSTKAQRARQQLFIPTEFTGMEIDEDGFIYATSIDAQGKQSIRRLNPKGQDVIVKKGVDGVLSGDLVWRIGGEYSGASRIVDVVVRQSGIYSMIDSTRGRIFTYDHEGNLLYIFGGIGTQEGTFQTPTAIEHLNNQILVLDAGRNAILSFSPSRYGLLINEAIGYRYDGDESKAVECWKEVLKLDSNFELAYCGIGKAYLSKGENKKAMDYFKLGMDSSYYSVAYKRYRNEFLKQNLQYILTGIVVIAVIGCIRSRRRAHD